MTADDVHNGLAGLRATAAAVARRVQAGVEELNALDGVAGDGDLGLTVDEAVRALLAVTETSAAQSRQELLREIGMAIARSAASTGGTLLATGFLRAAAVPDADGPLDQLTRCLRAAFDGIRQRGKAELGDKTMLDVLHPVVQTLDAARNRGLSFDEALRLAADTARDASEATAALTAKVGRAGWLADRAAGHVDAGGRLVHMAIEAIEAEASLRAHGHAGGTR